MAMVYIPKGYHQRIAPDQVLRHYHSYAPQNWFRHFETPPLVRVVLLFSGHFLGRPGPAATRKDTLNTPIRTGGCFLLHVPRIVIPRSRTSISI